MDKTFCVIIPARYKSSRFNGKPLADIKGIPMIVRTYNQCVKVCDSDLIWVATDDERIKRTQDLITENSSSVASASSMLSSISDIHIIHGECYVCSQEIDDGLYERLKNEIGDFKYDNLKTDRLNFLDAIKYFKCSKNEKKQNIY